jgi:NhaP-type Na+/H+ or K+/H+ antiporter
MRYHRSEPSRPWPLPERLWEARRGLYLGLFEAAILLGCVLIVVEFLGHLLAQGSLPLGVPALAFVQHWRGLIAVICAGIMWRMWMGELEMVNEQSETFEEIVIRDLKRIVDAVGPPEKWLGKER